MRQFSEGFTQHVNQEVTTLCNCWRIELEDGSKLGFTDHDKDLIIDQVLYEAASGFQASEVEDNLGFSVDVQDIMGALQSDKITSQDIQSRIFDNAKIYQMLVNWQMPEQNTQMRVWVLGEIGHEDGVFKANVQSLTSLLDQTSGRSFQRSCTANLGDQKCKIDLVNNFKQTVLVDKIVDDLIISVSGINTQETSWFRGGLATFTSGENVGHKIEIAEHFAPTDDSNLSVLHLWAKLPNSINVGDQLDLLPGCNKQFST